MRNPKWHRDEIILALDLYFKLESGKVHAGNPDIIELSRIINLLPIHEVKPDEAKFRNPNGVSLKLSNFLAIDRPGKGMSSYSILDAQIFNEFKNDKQSLNKIALSIRQITVDQNLNKEIHLINSDDDEESVPEGKVLYRLHKLRERNKNIVLKKKNDALNKFNKLQCEICGFDFYSKYGEVGFGFIECHHITPLSDLEPNTKTKPEDLALVCSNCHRMLHRKSNLAFASLKNYLSRV
ncbi:HNH endonuclease [Pedobacter metabolipauper]|uniref:5-methylcytosine-specific restriction protein A n=1 Tax=Pedobacter metabolipauper TaxID=425513 RepID=A0A4R6T251_9SPHI|nr:HNH endonuclease [Pedobacter metabolipauper]TDQ11401.1 5-methylcytosine-specific restriction protein A [Pedobacter metabolipauper]